MDIEALGIIDVGKTFRHGEFFGDIADDRSVVETADNAGLQGMGNIRPGHDGKLYSPGFVEIDIHRGLGNPKNLFFGLCETLDRTVGCPAIAAVAGEIGDQDPFIKGILTELSEQLLIVAEFFQLGKAVDEERQIDDAQPWRNIRCQHRGTEHALNCTHL